MHWAECLAAERQHFLLQRERLVQAAGLIVGNRQVVHRADRVGVLGAVSGKVVIPGLLKLCDGVAIKT